VFLDSNILVSAFATRGMCSDVDTREFQQLVRRRR
jgi:hypothetical protein